MKKSIFFILSVVALFSLVIGMTGCSKKKSTNPPPTPKPKWTILGYSDGNNNLDISQLGTSYVIEDIHEMEEIGSNDKVKVIIMLSSLKTGGNAKYYYIEKYADELPDSVKSKVLKDLKGKDMSDPATLKNFIQYGVENYPADHYMLIIDDHGGGWRGVCTDEQNGAGDLMSLPDLKNALSGTVHFDIIVFHACLMSMIEVAYQLKDKADYMVASEFTMPMESVLGSSEWLGNLVKDPNKNASELAQDVANAVYNAGVKKGEIVHMAVCDLAKVLTLSSKVSDLGIHLVTEVGSNQQLWNEVLDAWNSTHYTQYDDPAFVDLREFVKKVKQEPNLKDIPLIKTDVEAVITGINDAIPLTATNAAGIPRGGLTIHFPYNQELFDSTDYVKLDFMSTNWHAFLSTFIRSISGPEQETGVSGTVTYGGQPIPANTYACFVHGDTLYYNPDNMVSANGTYSIIDMYPGQYLIAAWNDKNGNVDIDTGDLFGMYPDLDNPQEVTVTANQITPNINFSISAVTGGKLPIRVIQHIR